MEVKQHRDLKLVVHVNEITKSNVAINLAEESTRLPVVSHGVASPKSYSCQQVPTWRQSLKLFGAPRNR